MASRPSLVTPSGRLRCSVAANFPRWRYQGYRPVGLQLLQVGVNGAWDYLMTRELTRTCTQKQITLLPTSTERLSISPALSFAKDQTQAGNNNDGCNGKETKAIKSWGKAMVEIWTGVPWCSLVMSLSQKTNNSYARWTNYSWAIDRIMGANQC